MRVQRLMLISHLLLAAACLSAASGTMLKCGEDIIVGRGERKRLKFWSAEDDLLKVQLVSPSEIPSRRPPGGSISYSKIPGLSEAILAHTKNKLSHGGLHYAGNPDIEIGHLFDDEESPLYDDYYIYSSQNQTDDSEVVETSDFVTSPRESGEIFSTTEPASDFVSTTSMKQLQTNTTKYSPTTSQPSTTQGTKLVTFFPDLQGYTRGAPVVKDTLTADRNAQANSEDAQSGANESVNEDGLKIASYSTTQINSEAEDSVVTNEQDVTDSQASMIGQVQPETGVSNETQDLPDEDIQEVSETTEENLVDPLLAILNGNLKTPVVMTADNVSSLDGTNVKPEISAGTSNVADSSAELNQKGLEESSQAEEDNVSQSSIDSMLGNEESEVADQPKFESQDESGASDKFNVGSDGETSPSQDDDNLEENVTEISKASNLEDETGQTVTASSEDVESSDIEESLSDSQTSTTPTSMGSETTTANSVIISENLVTEGGFDDEINIIDEYTSQVNDVMELGSAKYDTDSKDDVPVSSITGDSDDSLHEGSGDEKPEIAQVSEKSEPSDEIDTVTELGELRFQFMPFEEDGSGATSDDGELSTELPEKKEDIVVTTEQQMHEVKDFGISEADGSSVESSLDQTTTTLDELLRESLSDILATMNAENVTVTESAKEAPDREVSNDQLKSVDSIDEMEKIMSTLADESMSSRTPPPGPEDGYYNIKHVSMAGYQNNFDSAEANDQEYLLRQEDIPLHEGIDNLSLLLAQLPSVPEGVTLPNLEATPSEGNNGTAESDGEMNIIRGNLSPIDNLNQTELQQDMNRNISDPETLENTSESFIVHTSKPPTIVESDDGEANTEEAALSFEGEEDTPTSDQPVEDMPALNLKNAMNETSEIEHLVEDGQTTEIIPTDDQTRTTERYLTWTDATSQVPDGFKGYDYYENLYDSLMPQKETEGMIGIDDLLAQSGGSSEPALEVTALEDFDTDVLPDVDYDATKASIPKTSVDNGSQPLHPSDIEQARVPSPVWPPMESEPPTSTYAAQNDKDSLIGKIESAGEERDPLDVTENPEFDPSSDGQTKQDIPTDLISSDVTGNLKDIYQMRVKGPSLDVLRDTLDLNSVADINSAQKPILSQEIPYQEPDGREKVQNDILNSIASIIKDTLDSSDGMTENLLSTDATTEISNVQPFDNVTPAVTSAKEGDGEDSNASELVEIPLEIVNGEVKVSQKQPTSSLSVPLSALESEEAFDSYLKNNLVYGNHVLVLDNGEKVAVQSFDELTTALKSDQASNDTKPDGSDNDKFEANGELTAALSPNNTDLPKSDASDDSIGHLIADISNATKPQEKEASVTSQTHAETLENENGDNDSESEGSGQERVGDVTTANVSEPLGEIPLQEIDGNSSVSYDEAIENEALADPETNTTDVAGKDDVETSMMSAGTAGSSSIDENSGDTVSRTTAESGGSSKNVIHILEDMLFSDPNLDKLITEETAERSGNESDAQLDLVSESEGDDIPPANDDIANSFLASGQEASNDEAGSVNYSNDFDLSSLRIAENEYKGSTSDERRQWEMRKPARKDDSGFEFGGDTPFLMRLPGSPNPGLVYIQYEPVQVKYVPVEDQDSSANIDDEMDEDDSQFSRRTGIEHELNAIETDVLLNSTAVTVSPSDLEVHSEKLQKTEGMDASKGIYQMIGNVIPHFDYDVDPNPNPDVLSSTEGTHAHINIPLSFISQEPVFKEVPDPFIVMPPPDLTSQELVSPDDPAQSMYSHVIEPHAEFQSGNLDPLILEREKAEANLISGGEVGARKPDEDVLEPGKYYSSEHRGTIYGDVDLERLNNPVFKLQTKLHRPTADELMNPSFTPFPITTNPPREASTTQVLNKISTTPSTSVEETNEIKPEINVQGNSTEANRSSFEHGSPAEAALLNSRNDASENEIFSKSEAVSSENFVKTDGTSFKEPESVGFSDPPAVDFRLSYNPSDMPKFMKENPHAFPSWYPHDNADSSFRAEALTAEESTPLGSHRDATLEISGKNFADFDKFESGLAESARHSGNAFSRENRWPSSDNSRYGAFYHPADIPGVMMADLTRRHLSLPGGSEETKSSGLPWYKSHSNSAAETQGGSAFVNDPSAPLIFGPKFFKYLNSLPAPLLRDFLEPSPSERAVRMRRDAPPQARQIYCEWNIQTEPGLFLLLHFQNLSAPYSVDCHGAYIEVERENDGYDARYCGNRVAHMGNRPHVIFAKSEVRITVYDDGGAGKSKPTGFDADIDVIDLFNPNEYSAFMESESYPHIRRLLNG